MSLGAEHHRVRALEVGLKSAESEPARFRAGLILFGLEAHALMADMTVEVAFSEPRRLMA